MAKREPKSRHTTKIEVVGRPGERKGWIELGTGNLIYYRPSARTPTLSLTYQQLIALFEKEVQFRDISERDIKIPRSHPDGDFVIGVEQVDTEQGLFSSTSSIKKLDQRRIDLGAYQLSPDMANGRQSKHYSWIAQVSIQLALWIVHKYIEKFLVRKRSSTHTDEDVQVSKEEMKKLLMAFYKRISS
jgi:hypothetical protein